jgi:hypothetical protein
LAFTTAPTIAGATSIGGKLTVSNGGADVVGTLAVTGAATVSSTLTVTGAATFNGAISAGATPTEGNHLANKTYVDSVASGLHAKQPVRVRTYGTLGAITVGGTSWSAGSPEVSSTRTLTNAGTQAVLAIDGVTMVSGDRVLVDQNGVPGDGSSVGIYVVTNVGSDSTNWVLTRAADASTPAKLPSGSYVFVTEGPNGDNRGYVLTTNAPISLDADDLDFEQFSAVASLSVGGDTTHVQFNGGSGSLSGTSTLAFDASNDTNRGQLSVNNLKATSGQLGLMSGTTSTSKVLVGNLSSPGTPGDSVAFGLSSEVSAARGVALGANAVVRVADTLRITAMPIVAKSQTPGTGGTAATFASALTALTSEAFTIAATGEKAQFIIPGGSRFIPHSIMAWCETWTSNAGGRTIRINLNTASDGSGTVVGGSYVDILPSAVTTVKSSTLLNNTAIAAGTYYVYVASTNAAALGSPGDAAVADVRFTMFGLLIETA